MKGRIFRSTLTCLVLTLAVSLAMIIAVLNSYFLKGEQQRLQEEAILISTGMSDDALSYLQKLPTDSFRITWIARDGSVLYDSRNGSESMENHADREEFQQAMLNGSGEAVRYSSTMMEKTLYYAIRLDDKTVLRVAENYATIGSLTLRLISPILWILIAAVIGASILANHLAQRIAKPINEIDLDHPLDNAAYEEISPLLIRIDKQNKQINEQMEELVMKKQEFNSLSNNVSEGMILINRKSEVLSINKAAIALFHAPANAEGKRMPSVCRSMEMTDLVASVLQGKEAEYTFRDNDKTIKVMGSPIIVSQETMGGSILAMDISRDYEIEQQRREFTANVSHELKTPLQTIMGSAELLENHMVKPADQDSFIHRIHSESERMLTLIDDIIQLSRLDDEQFAAAESNVNLQDIVQEAISSLEKSAEEHHVAITADLKPAVVHANSQLLYEIGYNLIDNAIRYNKENGSIYIKTGPDGNNSTLVVQDTGIGIPANDQARVFERFYRVDKSHSRATGGTGLGLSIVKHAVTQCHGTIHLDSALGKGSTFTVTFLKK